MAISSANQKGKQVYVYDEKGARVGTHSGHLAGLHGRDGNRPERRPHLHL